MFLYMHVFLKTNYQINYLVIVKYVSTLKGSDAIFSVYADLSLTSFQAAFSHFFLVYKKLNRFYSIVSIKKNT